MHVFIVAVVDFFCCPSLNLQRSLLCAFSVVDRVYLETFCLSFFSFKYSHWTKILHQLFLCSVWTQSSTVHVRVCVRIQTRLCPQRSSWPVRVHFDQCQGGGEFLAYRVWFSVEICQELGLNMEIIANNQKYLYFFLQLHQVQRYQQRANQKLFMLESLQK